MQINKKIQPELLVYLLVTVILYTYEVNAQTLLGYTGLNRIPTAYTIPDNQISLNSFIINKNIATIKSGNTSNLVNSINLGFLPFLEITVILNNYLKSDLPGQAVGDRQVSTKLSYQPFEKLPTIGFGVHDPFGFGGEHASFYYLVLSKNYFSTNPIHLELTLGYAKTINETRGNGLSGMFYGVSINYIEIISLLIDNDTDNFNLGVRALFLKYLSVFLSYSEFRYPSGGVSIKFNI